MAKRGRSKKKVSPPVGRRPLMRSRSTTERHFHFDLPPDEPSLAESQDVPIQETTDGYSKNSTITASQKKELQFPSRISDGCRPLMRMRVPTRRAFAFSLPNHLQQTQEKDVVYDNISEVSQEDSSIMFKSHLSKQTEKSSTDKENTKVSNRRHSIASFMESSKSSNSKQGRSALASTKTTVAKTQNLETPALHVRKIPAVRQLAKQFLSPSIQDFVNATAATKSSQSSATRSRIHDDKDSQAASNISLSENEDRHDVYVSFAESDTDVVPDSGESGPPSNSEINLISEPTTTLAEELTLIQSEVNSLKGKIQITERTGEEAVAAPIPSKSRNSTVVEEDKKNRNRSNKNLKNLEEKKILNITGGLKARRSHGTTRHKSFSKRRFIDDEIMLISPSHNSLRNENLQQNLPSEIDNLTLRGIKRKSISRKRSRLEEEEEAFTSDSSVLSSGLSDFDRSKLKDKYDDVQEMEDDVLSEDSAMCFEFSDLDDTEFEDIQVQQPQKKKKRFFIPADSSTAAYFKSKMLPSNLVFEEIEVGKVNTNFLETVITRKPRSTKPKPPSAQNAVANESEFVAIPEVMMYKKSAKKRNITSILDLEVVLTVIHDAILEFRDEQTDSTALDMLKKYEAAIRDEFTNMIKKCLKLTETKSKIRQLEKEIREVSRNVGQAIDERISVQAELENLMKDNDEQEEESESETEQ